MRVKKLPTILALHLKRFKYVEQYNRHIKVSHRVVFPLELRLFNTSDDAVNPDRMYDLVAVVIHCGSGPNRGHYISIVKSHGFWLIFDDDIVDKIDPAAIEDFYGLTADVQKSSETGYILFYESRDPQWSSVTYVMWCDVMQIIIFLFKLNKRIPPLKH